MNEPKENAYVPKIDNNPLRLENEPMKKWEELRLKNLVSIYVSKLYSMHGQHTAPDTLDRIISEFGHKVDIYKLIDIRIKEEESK